MATLIILCLIGAGLVLWGLFARSSRTRTAYHGDSSANFGCVPPPVDGGNFSAAPSWDAGGISCDVGGGGCDGGGAA